MTGRASGSAPKRTVGPPFATVCALARGGMATVELVAGPGTAGRVYAVKRPRSEHDDDPEFARMFFDEGRIAMAVRHPNVVTVHHVGEDDRGPYMLMDFVDGVSVATLMRDFAARDELVPTAVALEIARQAALGLHAVHETRGDDGQALDIVHRDVSPQNLLIGFDGGVRLADFGIARAWGRSAKTSTGVLKGKAGYLSPEQLRFEPLDRRSDLFSLGVVLYELLAGERLYVGETTQAVARRVLDEPPPDIGEIVVGVAPAIVELVFSLLAKDPGDRPPTARRAAERLERTRPARPAIDLGEFCRERFSVEREELATRVREGLRRNRSGEVSTLRAVAEPPPSSRPRLRWLAGGLAAAAVIGLGAATLRGGAGVRSERPGRIQVSDLHAQWTTPNTVRWAWTAVGEPDDLLRYELVVGPSAAAVEADDGVEVWGPSRNPELGRFLLPRTGGRDPVQQTSTDGHPPDAALFAKLRAIDTGGTIAVSTIAGARTTLAPSEAVVLYDEAAPTTRPACHRTSTRRPFMGDRHLEYPAACDADGKAACGAAKTGMCWANLAVDDVAADLSRIRAGVFDQAFVELAVAVDGPVPSFWSEPSLRIDGTTWGMNPLTVRADSDYRVYQIKLAALRSDDRPMTHADLGVVSSFWLGGQWEAGSTVRIDAIRIRW